MKWWDRLLGRAPTRQEEDEEALRELRTSFREVRRRTNRIISEYEQAEATRRRTQ